MWPALGHSIREWKRSKLIAIVVTLLLAIGIGSNAVVFSFVNTLLLRELPVRDPGTLLLIEKTRVKQVRPDTSFFYREYEKLTELDRVFSSAIAEQEWSDLSFQRLSTSDSARLVTTQIVSPNYFSELGVHAIAGRVLRRSDATTSGDIPVVLSYQFWHSYYETKPDIVGSIVRIHDHAFRVVGVVSEAFHSLDVERAPDFRLPISAVPLLYGGTAEDPAGMEPIQFKIVARKAQGITLSAANAIALRTVRPLEPSLWRAWWTRVPPPFPRENLEERIAYEQNYRITSEPIARGIFRLRGQFSNSVLLLMGGVAFLMLGVCATVAGLLFGKAEGRKREIAIRLAMGAKRSHVILQMIREQLLLAIPGTLLGILFASAAGPALVRFLPNPRGLVQYAAMPQIVEVRPDVKVLLFAIALSIVSVIVFTLPVFWRTTQSNLSEALKGTDNRHTAESGASQLTTTIGVAIAIMLVAGSGAVLRSFWTLEHINPGFDRSHVVEFTIDPGLAGYSAQQAAAFRTLLRQRVRELPGVRSASFAHSGIMRGLGMKMTVTPSGRTLSENTFLNTSTNSVTPEYFATLGIPLLEGRTLEMRDSSKLPMPVVVNQAFAEAFFPQYTDVIGKYLVVGTDGTKSPSDVIVGVVGTAKYRSLRELDPPIVYGVSNYTDAGVFLYVNAVRQPSALIDSVRSVLRRLDPRMPLIEAFTLEEEVQTSLWQERIVSVLSAFFGVVALVLSALGLYATLAYSVERRRRDIGLRIALGAAARHIAGLIWAELRFSLPLGIIAGVCGSFVILRAAQALLFGIPAFDPISMVLACAILLAAAICAATMPALHAMRVDPAEVLREQ